jgi:hypothetical protein
MAAIVKDVASMLAGGIGDDIAKIVTLFKVPPEQVEQHAFELDQIKLTMAQKAMELAASQAHDQATIDLADAQSGKPFQADWRAAIGWVCAASFASAFVVRPIAVAIAGSLGFHLDYPALDMSTLLGVTFAILGIGVHSKLTEG